MTPLPLRQKRAFTLLEILLAVLVLGVMTLMIFGTFHSLISATSRAESTLNSLHVHTSVLEQIAGSLRASVFDGAEPETFEFVHEDGTAGDPDDRISWVSASSLLLPPDFPTAGAANRFELSMQDVDGERGLALRAFPSSWELDDPEVEEVPYTLISTQVEGLDVVMYDVNESEWTDEWERTRQLPISLILTLDVTDPEEPETETTIRQRVDIPVARLSRLLRRGGRGGGRTP
jgi:prepilin-type N-terminal cleavage/methylation domain-containing protein